MNQRLFVALIAVLLLTSIPPSSCPAQDFLAPAREFLEPALEFLGLKKKDPKAVQRDKDKKQDWRENAQIKQMVQQTLPNLRNAFGGELTFVKDCCQPDERQIVQMKQLARAELEQLEETIARGWAQQMGLLGNRRRVPKNDLTTAIEEAVARIVNDVFADDATQHYREEQQLRKGFKAQTGAAALVAYLDRQYYFDDDQRAALVESLTEAWQDEWEYYLQVMPHNPGFFPPVAGKSVIPHLKPHQAKMWRSKKTRQLGRNWNATVNLGIFTQQVRAGDEWFEGNDNPQQWLVVPAAMIERGDDDEAEQQEDDEPQEGEENEGHNDDDV